MKAEDKAREYFKSGCNCSQAVLLAFAEDVGLDEVTAKRVALGLGGGIGRMREVCGAVSAAAIVLGMVFGDGPEGKAAAYKKIQEFARRFRAESGSIICADRLGLQREFSDPCPERRTDAYYEKRPCAEICADAARIVSEIIEKRD